MCGEPRPGSYRGDLGAGVQPVARSAAEWTEGGVDAGESGVAEGRAAGTGDAGAAGSDVRAWGRR